MRSRFSSFLRIAAAPFVVVAVIAGSASASSGSAGSPPIIRDGTWVFTHLERIHHASGSVTVRLLKLTASHLPKGSTVVIGLRRLVNSLESSIA